MNNTENDQQPGAGLSIGAVSKATGIPTATLRTWERRYGYPDPARNSAGHRVYCRAIVDRLRLIDRAIDQGHRPCNVVGMPRRELVDLLSLSEEAEETAATDTSPLQAGRPADVHEGDTNTDEHPPSQDNWLDNWMSAVQKLDGDALNRSFRTAWNRLGGLQFLEDRAGPFLRAIGEYWRRGDLGIVHEHYASQCFRDFLSGQWRPLSDRARGPKAVCATLPGEDHALGLHLAALVLAMAGWRIVFLGPRTPLADIVHASRLESARAVFLSMSPACDDGEGRDSITALRRILDGDVELVVGGRGAPRLIDGVRRFDSLNPFYDWATEASK